MTKISSYIIDQNIVGNDKWIGSDAQNNLRTKNFTPNNLADYFNGNNVIDIGTSIRYRYQTLDIGEDREQGTISFETEIGPQVNFSDITTFLIAKNTLKGNTVTEYLDFLVDGKVILSKSSNINTFGYYKVTSIEPWIVDPNFFVVVVEFLNGNGFIYEDLDYLVSLVDKVSESGGAVWGSITGDINDQTDLINYISSQITVPNLKQVLDVSGTVIEGDNELYLDVVTGILNYSGNGATSGFQFNIGVDQDSYLDNINLSTGKRGRFLVDANGDLKLIQKSESETFETEITITEPTANRSITFKNESGTVAFISDIPTLTSQLTNDVPFLVQEEVEEYADLANFPLTGTVGVIYIALDTGLFYTWNGMGYIGSVPPASFTTLQQAYNASPSGQILLSLANGAIDLRPAHPSINFLFIGRNLGGTQTSSIFPDGTISGMTMDASIHQGGTGVVFQENFGVVKTIANRTGDLSTNRWDVFSRMQYAADYSIYYTDRTLIDKGYATSTFVPYTGATADVNLGEFGLLTGNIEFDNTPTNIPTSAGSMYWNDSDGTTNLILKGGNVTLQVGQEQLIRVVNKTATNVDLLEANYQAVRVTGAQGQRLKVDLAQATTDSLSAETIGLVTETINNNQEGFITTSGLVRNINTTGSLQGETWADGDILYLSPTTPGMATKVKPVAPDHLVILGYVVHAHVTQGSIFVKVDNGYELDELHNVKIDTPLDDQALVYNSALEVWENKTIATVGPTQNARATRLELTSDINLPISPTGSVTVVDFDNTIFNVDPTVFTNNGAGTVTCTLAGNYLITTSIVLESPLVSAITKSELGIRKNGTAIVAATTDDTPIALGNNVRSLTTSTIINLSANDTLQAVVNLFGASATGRGLRLPSLFGTTATQVSNISIERLEVSQFDVDSTPTDGSSNAVSSNGVFDALALKANLASPALTGTPTAPTQSANDNSTKIATTAYADAKVADSITDGVTTIAPSQNVVFDGLALKQDNYTNGLEYFNDFESSIPTTANGSLFGISMDGRIGKFGNGTSITYPNIPGSTSVHIGAPLLQSTSVNVWTGVGGNPLQGILLGNGVFEFNTLIQLSSLPDVTNHVAALFGLNDTINQTVSAVNAIAFVLENVGTTTAPSGSINWQCMTINNNVKTTTITSVAMSINWIKLSIIVNTNASSVQFFINNVLVATHTTNIPTARLAVYTALNKRNIGTLPLGYYIDYLHYKYNYTIKRL